TQYVLMSLAANDIPAWWGRIAHLYSWILLQGYVLFPSLFTAYDLADLDPPPKGTNALKFFEIQIFYVIRHVPLFWISWAAVIVGGAGMLWCLITWRRNYIWGLREIITPGLYGASTGLLSTVAMAFSGQNQLSAASKLTLFVTGSATGVFIILWIVYKHILLRNAKKKHAEKGWYVGLGHNGAGRLQATESIEGTGDGHLNRITQFVVST
ncbi:hypothetical protein M413DRAFT_76800, partial [Hebeloma cylindrosporum]